MQEFADRHTWSYWFYLIHFRQFSIMGAKEDARKFIDETIANNKVVVFSKSHCPFCTMAKKALDEAKCKYIVIDMEGRKDCSTLQDVLLEMTGGRTVSI